MIPNNSDHDLRAMRLITLREKKMHIYFYLKKYSRYLRCKSSRAMNKKIVDNVK